MTISYNWLSEYLPVKVEPERLSKILTAIGLEVEHMEPYTSVKGGLEGISIGEVLTCEPHPNADKLKVTTVNIGESSPIQVVCGAANVAAGQKVVVAKVGATIYPLTGDPITMKVAKIRGVESFGMICAEDEIGLGNSHDGIMVLPAAAKPGTPAAEYFELYSDIIYEIGLTPNRMDAMSHIGTAKDVMAFLAHHDKLTARIKQPSVNGFKADNQTAPITVTIENPEACKRYAGVSISGVTVQPSPAWLQNKLKAIGLRPINNIVDITNFILHETGQPLHAFDADAIKGNKIIVKSLKNNTSFITLDEKERKLSDEDLMICNEAEGMCIAGVFGGLRSGIKQETTTLFLESAWFNPVNIRKTSFRHGLRTDAATRFEKGVDISNTVNVLKRAALMIKEIAGGKISSDIVDVYPVIPEKTQVALKYHYLKKLSGKNYHPDAVKNILQSLGFELVKESIDELRLAVPFSKPDITHGADIVEEILRIDGLDNVVIPHTITMSPSIEKNTGEKLKEKIAGFLTGLGFNEILTNSITNSAYFNEDTLLHTVKMKNNLSVELDVMRPHMLPTGLETLAYNINRKNNSIRFFEFGKTYATTGSGKYSEQEHLCLYISGNVQTKSWNQQEQSADIYYLKGVTDALLQLTGIQKASTENYSDAFLNGMHLHQNGNPLLHIGTVPKNVLASFDIKQEVFFADINWNQICNAHISQKVAFSPLPKQLPVYRDLSVVVAKALDFSTIEQTIHKIKISKLQSVQLFDIFESEKLGAGKKSMAINFSFLDEEKTLTDKEIDGMMQKIMHAFEKELNAEIRK